MKTNPEGNASLKRRRGPSISHLPGWLSGLKKRVKKGTGLTGKGQGDGEMSRDFSALWKQGGSV